MHWRESSKGSLRKLGTVASFLWWKAERETGLFSLEKIMLRGISSVQVCLKEIYNGMGPGSFAMPIDRTKSNGHKLKCKRIYLNIGTCYFFPHWCWSTGTGCPERLWRSSKATWRWPWAPSSGHPCLGSGWSGWTQMSLPTSASLRFCEIPMTKTLNWCNHFLWLTSH